ncbi:MAG: hypothetical protein IM674_05365 [Brevundimonas sp.]|jgi:hypothetical protein|nr:hypothetical protein [Acidobacteriaceae bacterium]MCA3717663.1 hypothetical protein [Brevundimonas sp.]
MWNQYARLADWFAGKAKPVKDLRDADFEKIKQTLDFVSPDDKLRLLARDVKVLSASVQNNASQWNPSQKSDLSQLRQRFAELSGQPALSAPASEARQTSWKRSRGARKMG